MCLVIYAWAVAQDYFREMTDQSVREELYEEDKEGLEADMAPFGFILDGNATRILLSIKERRTSLALVLISMMNMVYAYSPWSWEQSTYSRESQGS